MCCVIPPASPFATELDRRVSRRVVFPWSTCPMIVTTGGRSGSELGSRWGALYEIEGEYRVHCVTTNTDLRREQVKCGLIVDNGLVMEFFRNQSSIVGGEAWNMVRISAMQTMLITYGSRRLGCLLTQGLLSVVVAVLRDDQKLVHGMSHAHTQFQFENVRKSTDGDGRGDKYFSNRAFLYLRSVLCRFRLFRGVGPFVYGFRTNVG